MDAQLNALSYKEQDCECLVYALFWLETDLGGQTLWALNVQLFCKSP